MKRGEIWTVAGGVYASKPRPAVILQADMFDQTGSVTVVPFTTDPTEAPLFRLELAPDAVNGLRTPCRIMVDKITTVPRANLGLLVGQLGQEDMLRLNRATVAFLGIV